MILLVFYSRPANFDVTNTDFAGGYNSPQNPNNTWAGWQASVYKSGVSVAQYVSWGGTSTIADQFVLNYDLSNSVMIPSYNENQPTRADIWLGNSSAGSTNRHFGITFNAGTIQENESLADGTTRNWEIYVEYNLTEGGMASINPGTREVLGTVGVGTWNKATNSWTHDFSVKLELLVTNNSVDAASFDFTFNVTSNNETQSFSYSNEEFITEISHRFIYGVNYTPDITVNNRKLPDLTNGGSWTGLIQEETAKYKDGVFLTSLGFLDGRYRNEAVQVGIYGSDVLTAKTINGKAVFTFRY